MNKIKHLLFRNLFDELYEESISEKEYEALLKRQKRLEKIEEWILIIIFFLNIGLIGANIFLMSITILVINIIITSFVFIYSIIRIFSII